MCYMKFAKKIMAAETDFEFGSNLLTATFEWVLFHRASGKLIISD